MSENESPAEMLRRAAVRMRVDAFACGDETTDFIPAVADWLDAEAAALDAIAQFNNVGRELVAEHGFRIKGAAISVHQDKSGAVGITADTSAPALAVANAYLGTRP